MNELYMNGNMYIWYFQIYMHLAQVILHRDCDKSSSINKDEFLIADFCVHACKAVQSYLSLCNPMDCGLQVPLSMGFFRQ